MIFEYKKDLKQLNDNNLLCSLNPPNQGRLVEFLIENIWINNAYCFNV